MSFDWLQYYYFAQELVGQNPLSNVNQECDNRNAVSRAYYAAFNMAKSKKGLVHKNGKFGHTLVIDEYKRSVDLTEIEIGEDLDRLIADRVIADYHDWRNVKDRMAENAVLTAESILKKLGSLP